MVEEVSHRDLSGDSGMVFPLNREIYKKVLASRIDFLPLRRKLQSGERIFAFMDRKGSRKVSRDSRGLRSVEEELFSDSQKGFVELLDIKDQNGDAFLKLVPVDEAGNQKIGEEFEINFDLECTAPPGKKSLVDLYLSE